MRVLVVDDNPVNRAIVERYDLTPVETKVAEPVRRAITLVPGGGGRVRARPRVVALAR